LPTAVSGDAVAGIATITFAIVVACAFISGEHARKLVAPRMGHACAPVRQHDIEQFVRTRGPIAPASGVRSNNASAKDAAAPRIDIMVTLIAQRSCLRFDARMTWKRIGIAVAIVAVIVAIAAAIAVRNRRGSSERVATVARKDLLVPILAGGTLEPPAGGDIRSPDAGVVAELFVHEGDRVRQGQPILRIANPQIEQQLLSGKSSVTQLGAEESRAQADADAAQREVERTKSVVDSDQRLVSAGAITKQQAADDELAYRQAQDRLRQAQAQVRSAAERRTFKESSTGDLARRSAGLVLRAPANGVIYNLPRSAGEPVQLGQLVSNAVDRDHLRVRIRVDEPDLPRIQPGQRIVVTFEGLPERRWDGTVTLVPPGVREVGGRQVGEVIGTFSDPTGALPPNASVSVEIVVGAKQNALVVPRAALFRDGAKRYVFRYDNGVARRVDVKVGLISPNETEILDGLNEGDKVVMPGTTAVTDGQRIDVATAT